MGAAKPNRMTAQELKFALASAQQGTWTDRERLFDELLHQATALVKRQFRGPFGHDPGEYAQQICTRMLENESWIQSYDPTKEALPFVLQVMRRSAYRIIRDQKAQKRSGEVEEYDSERDYSAQGYNWHSISEECPMKDEELEALARYMERLSPRDRAILELRGLKGVPTREVAEQLEITEGNVHQIFRRLKEKAKAFFEKSRGPLKLLVWFLPLFFWSLLGIANG